jgi:predicted RecB family endonuclease
VGQNIHNAHRLSLNDGMAPLILGKIYSLSSFTRPAVVRRVVAAVAQLYAPKLGVEAVSTTFFLYLSVETMSAALRNISRRTARLEFSQATKALPAASIASLQSWLDAEAEIPTTLLECGFMTAKVELILEDLGSPSIKSGVKVAVGVAWSEAIDELGRESGQVQ